MALTWREERPDAITAASHKAERPSRSIVTTFSALSSSSDARIRFSRSVCRTGFPTLAGAFLALGFLTDLLADLAAIFWAPIFWAPVFGELVFLTGALLAGALALAFFAGFGAGFLAAFRGNVPLRSGREVYHGLGGRTKSLIPERGGAFPIAPSVQNHQRGRRARM